MGGGAMHIDLPKIQFSSSSSTLPCVSSSSSSNIAASFRPSSTSASCCHGEICMKLDDVAEKDNKLVSGSFINYALGPVPSKPEVENSVAALQNFIDGVSSSRPEFKWLQPLLDNCGSRELLSEGLERACDAFGLLLREPSIKRLVVAVSSDKAFWDAIMNNELVRNLCQSSIPAVENGRSWDSIKGDISRDILQWILDMMKAKITELLLKFQTLLNDVFLDFSKEKPKANEETRDQFDEKIRSSLFLSIVVLLIVIVARVQRV